MSYIEFQNITKEYNTGGNAIFALKDASFSVEKGELANHTRCFRCRKNHRTEHSGQAWIPQLPVM